MFVAMETAHILTFFACARAGFCFVCTPYIFVCVSMGKCLFMRVWEWIYVLWDIPCTLFIHLISGLVCLAVLQTLHGHRFTCIPSIFGSGVEEERKRKDIGRGVREKLAHIFQTAVKLSMNTSSHCPSTDLQSGGSDPATHCTDAR